MNARQRRDARRGHLRRAYARSQMITAREAMTPATGRRSRVSYSGSGESGHGSEWSRPGNVGGALKPIVIDARWSDTVTRQASRPVGRYER